MSWGMFLCAISFFVSGFLEFYIERREEQSVSIFWQVPQITILAIAEILLSVTGYDFCYSNSSAGCKALILSLYLVTTAVGDCLAGILYNGLFQNKDRATTMYICGALMLANLFLFCRVARWFCKCREGKMQEEMNNTRDDDMGLEMT
jgi:dipeptide/tripeptide permease